MCVCLWVSLQVHTVCLKYVWIHSSQGRWFFLLYIQNNFARGWIVVFGKRRRKNVTTCKKIRKSICWTNRRFQCTNRQKKYIIFYAYNSSLYCSSQNLQDEQRSLSLFLSSTMTSCQLQKTSITMRLNRGISSKQNFNKRRRRQWWRHHHLCQKMKKKKRNANHFKYIEKYFLWLQ